MTTTRTCTRCGAPTYSGRSRYCGPCRVEATRESVASAKSVFLARKSASGARMGRCACGVRAETPRSIYCADCRTKAQQANAAATSAMRRAKAAQQSSRREVCRVAGCEKKAVRHRVCEEHQNDPRLEFVRGRWDEPPEDEALA